jgi:hypothetical protein
MYVSCTTSSASLALRSMRLAWALSDAAWRSTSRRNAPASPSATRAIS